MTNISEFVKDGGLVKITGPKCLQVGLKAGEIDVEEKDGSQ